MNSKAIKKAYDSVVKEHGEEECRKMFCLV